MKMTIMETIAYFAIIFFLLGRVISGIVGRKRERETDGSFAIASTKGTKEIQADVIEVEQSQAGFLAVMADGIGKENTGKCCAKIAVDTVLDAYESYEVMGNVTYFFQSSFLEANEKIQKTIGERRGGSSLLAIFQKNQKLSYALAGEIKLAFFRNGEFIPVSKGQTVAHLAKEAFYEGSLSKYETLWSQEEKTIWNYVGKEGFHDIEQSELPIQVKQGDIVIGMTKGIYEQVSFATIENIVREASSLQEKADQIVMEAEKNREVEKENGSILLFKVEV